MAAGLVEDLVPDACCGVLVFDDAVGEGAEEVDECGAVGVVGGHLFEYVNECHCDPSLCSSPCVGCLACGGVGPSLGVAFVPCVAVESGGGVVGVACYGEELVGDVVPDFGVAVEVLVVVDGVEGLAHEEAVEPHLVGVDLFVPEASFGYSGVVLNLVVECVEGCEVFGVGCAAVGFDEECAVFDLVDVVFGYFVGADCSVGCYEGVDVCEDVFFNVGHGVAVGHAEHCVEFGADGVGPFGVFLEVELPALGVAGYFAEGHVLGDGLEGAVDESVVDGDVGEADVACASFDGVSVVGYVVPAAVFDLDVADVADVFESFDFDAPVAFAAGDVFEVDVLHDGGISVVAGFVAFVDEVDFEDCFGALSYFDVAAVDVFDYSASACVGFDADYAFEVGGVHDAVFGEEPVEAA